MRSYTIESSPEELLAQARQMSGVAIVDEDAVEPLTVIVEAFNQGGLHEAGAKAAEHHLIRILCNRLRQQRDFLAHPEIDEQTVESPIIIWGLTRTGSTKTQKLLSASGDFNYLPFWQSLNPALFSGSRGESTQPRIDGADGFVRWLTDAAPEVNNIHAISTHEPEEESFIQMQSLRTQVFMGYSDIGSYAGWLSGQDMKAQLNYVKKTLKYLQWQGLQSQSKRWVLKSPLYLGMEKELLEVFPDACLVMTHRQPQEVIPSTCSLWTNFRKPYTNDPIDYHAMTQGVAHQLNQHLDFRKQQPNIKILDINYKDIIEKIDSVAEKIYQFAGVNLTDESRKSMTEWNRNNSHKKQGRHKYSLEEFDLDNGLIKQWYKVYIDFLRATF